MISWLTLEEYRLGRLSRERRAEVERAIAEDAVSRARWERVANDVLVLPPLPEPRPVRSFRWWPALAPAFAVAVLIVWARPQARDTHMKGGAAAVSLIRERDGSVAYDGDVFAPGDRFKIRYTCAETGALFYDVAVHQADATAFPLPAGERLRCANQVVLSGAISLSGDTPAAVCVRTGEAPPVRVPNRSGVCVMLTPTR
jgi:hypothetical protein